MRLVRGDNVIQGQLRWENAARWPSDHQDDIGRYRLEPGDVVLAMDRPWIEAGLKYARFCCAPPAVLDAFEASTHPMSQWIGAAETEDRTLAAMRDYLLPKLLSGQVRVEAAHG